jgi:periplasmic divalent cation tolerance protein
VTDARVVLTTAGSEDEARNIAHALVERHLAACVNILPRIESVYRWQGNVESAQEWLLVIKTIAERFPALREAIKELHSYDLPECICLPVEAGSDAYLDWISDNVKQPKA